MTVSHYASGFNTDCYWQFPENAELSDVYADKLHGALKKRFPRLNFILIIMRGYEDIVEEERRVAENMWTIQFNPGESRCNRDESQLIVWIAFRELLMRLIQHRDLPELQNLSRYK